MKQKISKSQVHKIKTNTQLFHSRYTYNIVGALPPPVGWSGGEEKWRGESMRGGVSDIAKTVLTIIIIIIIIIFIISIDCARFPCYIYTPL